MKKCPYCAENIQDDAVICQYCGRKTMLGPEEPVPMLNPANSTTTDQKPNEFSPQPTSINSKKPVLGIISCVAVIVSIILFVFGIGFSLGILPTSSAIFSLAVIALSGLCIITGLVCGIIGLFQKNRRRIWAIIGTILNGTVAVGTCLILVFLINLLGSEY